MRKKIEKGETMWLWIGLAVFAVGITILIYPCFILAGRYDDWMDKLMEDRKQAQNSPCALQEATSDKTFPLTNGVTRGVDPRHSVGLVFFDSFRYTILPLSFFFIKNPPSLPVTIPSTNPQRVHVI